MCDPFTKALFINKNAFHGTTPCNKRTVQENSLRTVNMLEKIKYVEEKYEGTI